MLTVHNNQLIDGYPTQENNLALNLSAGKVIVTYVVKEIDIHQVYRDTYQACVPLSSAQIKGIAKIKQDELILEWGIDTFNSMFISTWQELTGLKPMIANGEFLISSLDAEKYLAVIDYLTESY